MASVVDKTVDFEIRSHFTTAWNTFEAGPSPPTVGDDETAVLPLVNSHEAFDDHEASIRAELNAVKKLLDDIPTEAYYAARDLVFPLAQSGSQGSKQFFNRAGHKLLESMTVVGVWEHLVRLAKSRNIRQLAFADVCGGPGAFSQALFATAPKYFKRLRGYGMTLLDTSPGNRLQWYPALLENPGFIPTGGIEGAGNIYATENLHALVSLSKSYGSPPMMLVVADGGFDVPFEVAHAQETISARLVFGQWLSAVLLLQTGGCLVLKLFDTFSPFSRSLLLLSTVFFKRVFVVKPKHSRVVNSERYLVVVDFDASRLTDAWREYLLRLHGASSGFAQDHPEIIPKALVPESWLSTDCEFEACLGGMNRKLAETQIAAIQMVLQSPALVARSTESAVPTPESQSESAACSA